MVSIFNPFEGATKPDNENYQKLLDKLLNLDSLILKDNPLEIKKFQLIDSALNHFKFYHISLFNDGYVSHYGRIGAKGSIYDSRIKKGVMNKHNAESEFILKCLEKVGKGYKEIK